MSKKLRSKDLISLKDSFHKFETCYKDIKIEFDNFCEKSNQNAAKRARKKLMEITRLAKEIRNSIQSAKENAIEDSTKIVSTIKPENKDESQRILKKLNPRLEEMVGLDKK